MIFILLFTAFLASDIWVKHWAVNILMEKGSMEVLPGILAFTYAENKGAAFSMLSGARWFFVVIAVVFIGVLIYMHRKNYFTTWWSKLGAVMIAAGTVGNAIDRMRYGYVVDMFELKFIDFAIFNVADIFITLGAVLFLLYMLVYEIEDKKKKEAEKLIRDMESDIKNYHTEIEMPSAAIEENDPEGPCSGASDEEEAQEDE